MADSSGKDKQDNKGKSSPNVFGSTEVGSDQHRGDLEVHTRTRMVWNNTYAGELKGLLLSNLRALFECAIKQIVQLGYSKDVAEKALSRKALYIRVGDPISNVVNDTLKVLKGKKEATSDRTFDNFQHMLDYTLLELIKVLCEVRPSLTDEEAMWSLLVCDLNVSLACTVEDLLNVVINGEGSTRPSSTQLKSEAKSSDISSCTSQESPLTHKKRKFEAPTHKKCKSEAPTFGKLQNSPNEKSSFASERVKPEENNSLPTVSGRPFEASEDVFKGGSRSKRQNRIPDYLAVIPYDKSLGKYVPRDKNDESILKLVSEVEFLESELQSWTDWATLKIKQVTSKLNKLKPELKMLKKVTQETEKDAIAFQENAAKKISEVDNATENTKKLIESTNSDALILEAKNALLSKELIAEQLSFETLMTRHQHTLEREQTARKKTESLESEIAVHRDDIEREKQKLSKLQQQLDKEKIVLTRIEGRVGKESAEKEKLLAKTASLENARKHIEDSKQAEEDKLGIKAAHDLEKYVEQTAKLETELEEIKQKRQAAKIAVLRKHGLYHGKSKIILSQLPNCIRCLFEERSVVFIPCGHQLLCGLCNKLNDIEGKMKCATCRRKIKKSIHVEFVEEQGV